MKNLSPRFLKYRTFVNGRLLWPAATIGALALLFYAIALDLGPQTEVLAQTSSKSITGYAWSETIGWVSFKGSNYGFSVAANGTITGYAWSDNIGWISANSGDLTGCPGAPCTATIDSTGALKGWLRALSGGTSQSGDWDGFISLSGANYGPKRQTDGTLSGYAWGSTVVGWLSFAFAATDYAAEPAADLKVRKAGTTAWSSSVTIEPTDQIELGWNQSGTANTRYCDAVPPSYGFSTGSGRAVSGIDIDVEEPIGNTSRIYSLLCESDGGAQKTGTVNVSTRGGVGARFCAVDRPTLVPRGTEVDICWTLGTNNPAACSIKAGATDVRSPLPGKDGTVKHRMLGEVTFTLSCVGGDGDSMTVKVLPDVQET